MSASLGRVPGRLERVLVLRSFPGLSRVDPSHLAALADVADERDFERGSTLLTPGQPVRAMHFIRRGQVAVLRDGVPVRRFRGGDIVGGIGALTQRPEGQHVVAEEDTRTFEISHRDFLDVLEESFPVLLSALSGISKGVLQARREIPADAGFSAPLGSLERPFVELGLVERVLFLRRLATYGRASVEALAELAREMRPVRVPAGTVLWEPGDAASHTLLLWSGIIACETPEGHVFRFGPDSVVGGIDAIAGEPRWYRAKAETEVLALRSEIAHLFDVLEDHTDMGLDMLRGSARILAELRDRLDQAALERRTV